MMSGRIRLLALLGVAGAWLACSQILDAGSYHVVPALDAGMPDSATCTDPSGFGGKGCFSCPPTNRKEFLNACSGASCSPFDNSQLSGLSPDGGLPALPAPPNPDAGQPPDTGGADTGPALPACSGLSNPVFAAGSSAVTSFLAQAAVKLNGQPTVVFLSAGSCTGITAMLDNDRFTGVATYWDPAIGDPSLAAKQCELDPAGVLMDVGVSDVFATTCQSLPQGLPPTVADYFGPVQVMTLATSSASQRQAISAEALYLIFGFGDQ